MPSTLWRILEEVQKRLKGMSFSAEAGDYCQDIPADNIVIWKPNFAARAGEENLSHVSTPGLIITPPRRVTRPPMEGTNARDDAYYPILIQLVDSDNQERTANLPTYTKWEEQIARACNARGWIEVEPAKYGDVYASFAETTDTVDTKLWKQASKFVSAVAVVFKVREPRGIET